MNAKRSINAIKTMMQQIKKNLMSKKKIKIKITNDFITDEKTLNAKIFKKTKIMFN